MRCRSFSDGRMGPKKSGGRGWQAIMPSFHVLSGHPRRSTYATQKRRDIVTNYKRLAHGIREPPAKKQRYLRKSFHWGVREDVSCRDKFYPHDISVTLGGPEFRGLKALWARTLADWSGLDSAGCSRTLWLVFIVKALNDKCFSYLLSKRNPLGYCGRQQIRKKEMLTRAWVVDAATKDRATIDRTAGKGRIEASQRLSGLGSQCTGSLPTPRDLVVK